MTSAFTFSWNDHASVRRALAQITALASLCDQISVAIAQAAAAAPAQAALQMRLITASTALTLAAEDCRDAARQLGQLLP